MIILLFISAVFAPLPLPIQKIAAILPETHPNFGPASKHHNLRLSQDQQLVRLNALYALPDDIQVKIISDTQNAQNAIQWLKMNKASSDKLIKDPNFQPMLPEVLKLSIVDKYYDADILKRILEEPNLVNWNIKGVQSDAKYALDIETFAKVIKDVDLSSAAGRQIKEYSLMNIGKFIDENPGKSLELVSRDSDIMAKIILSDSALTTKFTNDLSIADVEKLHDLFRGLIFRQKINFFKLILKNPKVTDSLSDAVINSGFKMAVFYERYEFIKLLTENSHVSQKISTTTIDEVFTSAVFHRSYDMITLYSESKFLSQKLSLSSLEDAFRGAIFFKNAQAISRIMEYSSIWKDMKFSLDLKDSYRRAGPEIKQIIEKNALFKKKIDEIEG